MGNECWEWLTIKTQPALFHFNPSHFNVIKTFWRKKTLKIQRRNKNDPLHDRTSCTCSEFKLFLFFQSSFGTFLPSSFCCCDHSLVHGLVWNCCKLYYLSKGQRGQDRLWDSVKFKDTQWGRALCALITQGSLLLKLLVTYGETSNPGSGSHPAPFCPLSPLLPAVFCDR